VFFEEFDQVEMVCFYNGYDSIDYIKNNKNEVDLIFMDINMPNLDGVQTIKLIRKFYENISNSHLPFISYVSSY
jgi:putative two-component system response regulator